MRWMTLHYTNQLNWTLASHVVSADVNHTGRKDNGASTLQMRGIFFEQWMGPMMLNLLWHCFVYPHDIVSCFPWHCCHGMALFHVMFHDIVSCFAKTRFS